MKKNDSRPLVFLVGLMTTTISATLTFGPGVGAMSVGIIFMVLALRAEHEN